MDNRQFDVAAAEERGAMAVVGYLFAAGVVAAIVGVVLAMWGAR